jgi:prophage tail gpP-like protein
MPNPIPGKQYTVVNGDNLSTISTRAYGTPNESPRIFAANQSRLKSDSPDLIFPGEVLNIPVIAEIEEIRSRFFESQGVADGVELKIEDRILPVQSASITRTMDTAADGWTAVFAWEPGLDAEIDELTRPYSYPKATISLDGELKVSGRLYDVEVNKDLKGRSKTLWGYSYTIDAVDSTIKPPYEANNITIVQRGNEILKPLGIKLDVTSGIDTGGVFDRITSAPTEKIAAHLKKLADQRSLLVSSTPAGAMLLTQADINSSIAPVGTIEEDISFVEKWSAKFEGRKRFSVYRAIGQGADKTDQKVGIAVDLDIPLSRFMTFSVNDSLKGEMNEAAAWRRNREAAKALSIPFPVNTWYAPNNEQWRENTRAVIKSPTLDIPDGDTFLIRQVDFKWGNEGKNAVLHIIPVSYYSKKDLNSPW